MMRYLVFLIVVFVSKGLFCQPVSFHHGSQDRLRIRQVLKHQTEAWNHGDLEGFMQGYWKHDSLAFIGKTGVKWGWKTILENYKRNYPDTASMGKLSFDTVLLKKLSRHYYYVIGKWMLKRGQGDVSGYYNLLFKKIKGQWLIIADHSS